MPSRAVRHTIVRILILIALVFSGLPSFTDTSLSFDPDSNTDRPRLDEKLDVNSRNGLTGAMTAPGKRNGKVQKALRKLIEAHESEGPQKAAKIAQEAALVTRGNDVLAVLESAEGMTGRLQAVLESSGATVLLTSGNMTQAFLPLTAIDNIASQPEVSRIRRPLLPMTEIVAESLGVIGAGSWQAFGVTGSGVKIGIIDAGFYNYSALLGSELPPANRVQVRSFRWDGDITAGGERHGTAVAEIVYDIAPAADLYLANIATDVDFGSAVDWMIANGVNVISMSLGWAGANNYDGAGFIAGKVNAARAAGIFWSNSAGNIARRHWEGLFSDPDSNGLHNFAVGDEGNTISASAGSTVFGALTWNDSWNVPSDNYDLYLVRSSTGQIVASSTEVQGPWTPPSEQIYWYVDQPGNYYFAIDRLNGSARNLELYTYRHELEYQVAASSLTSPADADGAVAVGAFYYNTGAIENFSSQGPTNDGRIKPDLAAPDGVITNSYYGSGYGYFFGTSAAAPHVAGAAALVKQVYPSYTPAQVRAFLEGKAIDAGNPGKDNVYGSGRLNLGSGPPPILALSTTSLDFLADSGTNPSPQPLTITNAGLGTLSWAATETSSWLTLTSSSGTTPATTMVVADRTNVITGTTVSAQIRVDGTTGGTQNTPQYVNVTLKYSARPLSRAYIPAVMKAYSGSW